MLVLAFIALIASIYHKNKSTEISQELGRIESVSSETEHFIDIDVSGLQQELTSHQTKQRYYFISFWIMLIAGINLLLSSV